MQKKLCNIVTLCLKFGITLSENSYALTNGSRVQTIASVFQAPHMAIIAKLFPI
jgi:hypothetical protein